MLRFRYDLIPTVLGAGRLLLVGEGQRILLAGPLYVNLALMFEKNSASRAEIVTELAKEFSEEEVERALAGLESAGLLRADETETRLSAFEAAYWESLGRHAPAAEAAIQTPVSVLSLAEAGEDSLRAALALAGIPIAESGSLLVVLADDYLDERLARVNLDACRTRRPMLLVKPVGREVWIGPLLVPGTTACWECLRHRLLENRWVDRGFWAAGAELPSESCGALPSTISLAASIAATETARYLVEGASRLTASLITFDTVSMQSVHHPVARLSGCPRCNGLGRPRLWTRSDPPDPARLLERQCSSITGLFAEPVERGGGLWAPVSIHTTRFAAPIHKENPREVRAPQTAVGRGLTPAAARFAAMAEAVERYSSYANGQEQTVTATLADLGDRAVAPDRLLLYSVSQGGAALPSDQPVQWMEARNRTGGPARLVPAACCLLGHPEAGAAGEADSNGCAAGESLEDAALRGFYELVEREAAAFWWYHRARRPAVDLDAFPGGVPAFLRRLFARNGWNLHLLDLTTDWEIPAYAAVCDRDGGGLAYAFGAHHDPETAAASAITELAQTVHSLSEQAHSGHWLNTARLSEHPYLAPAGCVPPAAATKGGLDRWARRAAGLGLELLTVDLTRPEIAVPVVRVLVPGICHYQPRWAPGRLYEVPLKLGWTEPPVSEERLNPRPCPIL